MWNFAICFHRVILTTEINVQNMGPEWEGLRENKTHEGSSEEGGLKLIGTMSAIPIELIIFWLYYHT